MREDPLDPAGVCFLTSFLLAAKGYIFPRLRLASMEWTRHCVDVYYYVDGPVSDDNEESFNLISTYFDVDFDAGVLENYSDHIIRVDSPEPISFQGQCIYARKETPPIGKIFRGLITEQWPDRFDKICIAIQRAMVGNIFPQIRDVVVSWNEVSASIYFVVHGEISDAERKNVDQIVQYFRLQFPKEEMTVCGEHIVRIDFPAVPNLPETLDFSRAISVYSRQEYSSMRPREPYTDQ